GSPKIRTVYALTTRGAALDRPDSAVRLGRFCWLASTRLFASPRQRASRRADVVSDGVVVMDATTVVATPRSQARRLIVAGLKIALALAIAGFMTYSVITQWAGVRRTWLGLPWHV